MSVCCRRLSLLRCRCSCGAHEQDVTWCEAQQRSDEEKYRKASERGPARLHASKQTWAARASSDRPAATCRCDAAASATRHRNPWKASACSGGAFSCIGNRTEIAEESNRKDRRERSRNAAVCVTGSHGTHMHVLAARFFACDRHSTRNANGLECHIVCGCEAVCGRATLQNSLP